ncbi:hypothetical protein [Rhizobium sp. SYY.PMSO]|uniref:hypothetical protein n=1 Tax=Rhizobium sp. SYY.PMSO TaxID=3382192 RepID=UPI003990153C
MEQYDLRYLITLLAKKGFASNLPVLRLIRILCASAHLLDASNVGGEIFALLCPPAFDEDDLAASMEADHDRTPTAKKRPGREFSVARH